MLKGFLAALAMAGIVCAQPSRPSPVASLAWLDGALANDFNLTDAQTKQIHATVSEYRGRLAGLRAAVNKSEADLEALFNEDTVDQRKANEAINQLVAARSELFRTNSQLDLKLRAVLTADQWQDLKNRRFGRGGTRRRGPGAVTKTSPAAPAPVQPTKIAPSISSQK